MEVIMDRTAKPHCLILPQSRQRSELFSFILNGRDKAWGR